MYIVDDNPHGSMEDIRDEDSIVLQLLPNVIQACHSLEIVQDNFFEFVEIFYFEITSTSPAVNFTNLPPLDG